MNNPQYFLSDILFDQEKPRFRIVDLETGNSTLIAIDAQDEIDQVSPFFVKNNDLQAITQLQALVA